MTAAAKLVFFVISLVAMAGFAGASLLLADNRWAIGGVVMLASIFVIGIGFMVRGRILRQSRSSA